jgi:hypothetical protein
MSSILRIMRTHSVASESALVLTSNGCTTFSSNMFVIWPFRTLIPVFIWAWKIWMVKLSLHTAHNLSRMLQYTVISNINSYWNESDRNAHEKLEHKNVYEIPRHWHAGYEAQWQSRLGLIQHSLQVYKGSPVSNITQLVNLLRINKSITLKTIEKSPYSGLKVIIHRQKYISLRGKENLKVRTIDSIQLSSKRDIGMNTRHRGSCQYLHTLVEYIYQRYHTKDLQDVG